MASASSLRPCALQQAAQVGVRVGVGRIDRDRAPVGRFGLVVPLLPAQQDAEVVVDVGALRREQQRLLVGVRGRIDLAGFQQHVAEVAVPVGHRAVLRDRAADRIDGLRAAASLVLQHAHEVQRIGMVGRGLEDALVDLLRVVQPVGAVHGDGKHQRLVEAHVGEGLEAGWNRHVAHGFTFAHRHVRPEASSSARRRSPAPACVRAPKRRDATGHSGRHSSRPNCLRSRSRTPASDRPSLPA